VTSLLLLVAAIMLTRVYPGAPIRWYTRRFQRSVEDGHLPVLLTAATPDRLDAYIRREYPGWYLPELVTTLWNMPR